MDLNHDEDYVPSTPSTSPASSVSNACCIFDAMEEFNEDPSLSKGKKLMKSISEDFHSFCGRVDNNLNLILEEIIA